MPHENYWIFEMPLCRLNICTQQNGLKFFSKELRVLPNILLKIFGVYTTKHERRCQTRYRPQHHEWYICLEFAFVDFTPWTLGTRNGNSPCLGWT